MTDTNNLRVLIVEDSEDDALLISRHLKRSGFNLTALRVETSEELVKALKQQRWDLLLVDYQMPNFSGLDVLNMVKQMNIDLPFILVSGAILEETAVEAMRQGAKDCINKDNLERLVPTVKRELQAAQERLEREKAQEELRISHANLEREIIKRTDEYKKAKEEAEAGSRSKSEFLANISHELRNPMHQILSYSKYGIDKIDQPKEKLLHYFKQTRSSAERLMILLDDLLDLSKMESGKMEYSYDRNDVYHIISEIVTEFKPVAKQKSLNLLLAKPDLATTTICDYYKIGQVVRNLLSNAIKFSPNGKSIEIKLASHQPSQKGTTSPQLQISVSDQGIGIPVNELAMVFDKFTQSSRTKTGAGGTGLGLSICQEIIKAHEGTIWAENNPEGGAVFKFTLPFA